MRAAIAYPPIKSRKGVPLLSQNRQFQWFHRPTYIYPVVPALAATMADRAGHEVIWLDGIAEQWSEEEFLSRLCNFKPDVVLLETKTPVVKAAWQWADRIKKESGAKVALAGDHVTALPDESLEKSTADFVLTGGDYDFLFVSLLDHLAGRASLERGIRIRDGTSIRSTGSFACDRELSSLPWIDRDLTRWRLYSVHNGNYRRVPGTYTMAGRDCWHGRCTFCSWTTLYPRFRARPPEDLLDEIGCLIEKYGVREVMDDTGTFPVGEWLRSFCAGMIKRGYNDKIYMDCNMRFGVLKRDDYLLMKEAGFRFVLFGLESANQRTLDRLNKNLKVEDILSGARDAARAGLDVHVTVMFGYPWETADDVARTVELARRLLIEGLAYTLQVTLVIPYPGTPLFREAREQGWLVTEDWDDFDMRMAVMKTPIAEDEIKSAIRTVYRAFLHPRALWNRALSTKHPIEDLHFYWRGIRSLFGHLRDFGRTQQG